MRVTRHTLQLGMVNSKEKGGPSGPPPWYVKGKIFPLKLYGRPGHPPRSTATQTTHGRSEWTAAMVREREDFSIEIVWSSWSFTLADSHTDSHTDSPPHNETDRSASPIRPTARIVLTARNIRSFRIILQLGGSSASNSTDRSAVRHNQHVRSTHS